MGNEVKEGTGIGFDFAGKKSKKQPEKPTLKNWITILPPSPLKTDLERRLPKPKKKKETPSLPTVKSPRRSVTTGESEEPGGKIKPHRPH